METFVVFHDIEYGGDASSDPNAAPSSFNWTPTTPTLSEAVDEIITVPETGEPSMGVATDTAGGVVSDVGGAALLTLTVTGADVPELPAASRATAVSV